MTDVLDRSFKYAMLDTTKLYIGGRMTYQDMIEWEDVPIKMKAIVNKDFVPDAGGTEYTFEEHLRKLKKDSYAYQVFKTLKAKFKVHVPVLKGGKTAEDVEYAAKNLTLDAYMEFLAENKGILELEDGTVIKPVTEEISFSKLAMMIFSA